MRCGEPLVAYMKQSNIREKNYENIKNVVCIFSAYALGR